MTSILLLNLANITTPFIVNVRGGERERKGGGLGSDSLRNCGGDDVLGERKKQ